MKTGETGGNTKNRASPLNTRSGGIFCYTKERAETGTIIGVGDNGKRSSSPYLI